METVFQAQIPQRLARETEALVRDGWASDVNSVLVEALRRYLESHRPDLTESFIREDVEWGLHGKP